MNIARQHLALLGVLDALLTERSVTRAADKLHLTQPAMSNALARLRDLLNDPLLVREGQTMVLTPKAVSISTKVREIVAQANALLDDANAFDPQRAVRTFTLAVSDTVGQLLVPELVATLADEAPNVSLRVIANPSQIPIDALADGTIDLVAAHHAQIPERLHASKLYDAQLTIIARKNHPQIKSSISLDQFLSAPHVVIFPHALSLDVELQRVFQENGKPFHLFASVQQVSVAAHIVGRTDAIALFPRRLAKSYAESLGLKVLDLPKGTELPLAGVYQVWHERAHNDSGHKWLRKRMLDVVEQSLAHD